LQNLPLSAAWILIQTKRLTHRRAGEVRLSVVARFYELKTESLSPSKKLSSRIGSSHGFEQVASLNMPRIQLPWYRWRISWRNMPWFVVSLGAVWGCLYLIRSDSPVAGLLLLLVSLASFWGSLKTLSRNRQPFVFEVRGYRKVKFRGGGRDQTIFEEGGQKVRIYTELMTGKTSRAIHVN
jgi:hypothetical protein